MKRVARLRLAQAWIPAYTGKDIVRDYAKHYGVSRLCAAIELGMAGLGIDQQYVDKLKSTEQDIARQRHLARLRRRQREDADTLSESDDSLAYIAGYTPWGFPYGVTWQEMAATDSPSGPDESQ